MSVCPTRRKANPHKASLSNDRETMRGYQGGRCFRVSETVTPNLGAQTNRALFFVFSKEASIECFMEEQRQFTTQKVSPKERQVTPRGLPESRLNLCGFPEDHEKLQSGNKPSVLPNLLWTPPLVLDLSCTNIRFISLDLDFSVHICKGQSFYKLTQSKSVCLILTVKFQPIIVRKLWNLKTVH